MFADPKSEEAQNAADAARRQTPATPPTGVVAVAAVLSFIPSFLVMEFFMDLTLAVIGSVLLAVAVLMLGRWRTRQIL